MAKTPKSVPAGPTVSRTVTLGTDDIPVKTTRPTELRRHNISDEELDMLADTKHDHLTEAMWAAIGGAVSSLTAAIADIHGAYFVEGAEGLSGFALAEVIIFVITTTAAICLGVVVKTRGKKADGLVARIKARGAE